MGAWCLVSCDLRPNELGQRHSRRNYLDAGAVVTAGVRLREIGRRVKRWQNNAMVLRWTAAGVLEAERGFRKVVGYRAMPILVAALSAHDAHFNRKVDDREKSA